MHRSLNPAPVAPSDARQGLRIRVRGVVQGVGFRPAVWRIARALALQGRVRNDGDGVLIEIQGEPGALRAFLSRLRSEAPPLARIETIQTREIPARPLTGFHIAASAETRANTPVAPDAATCPACLAEIRDPENRRYRYPFTNCTHCGPRLSIVAGVPYDRANTSMASFALCPACQREYDDPADRRFHAQPNACPACGPRLWFQQEERVEHGDAALGRAVDALKQGAILAVKGIGGFHLICDAGDEAAVARLRARKQRPAKPFALMGRDLAQIRRHVHVPAEAAELLGDPAAPIVLLDKREDRGLPEIVAPDQACLGFMLPYSPLHRLLLDGLERPVIATSGNVGGLPPCTDNDQALRQLAPVADGFLLHDRAILNRVDDSVARWHRGRMWMLRRARGYAPAPLPMPPGLEAAPDLLALGGELKNTFCLVKQGRAILSQHMGDLKNAETFDDFRHNLSLYARLYAHRPRALAVDRHPDYLSTRLGQSRALETGVPIIEVQHHHAHIAACLAEHGWPLDGGPVIGVALDGIGHGDDGGLWGGEVLRADYRGFTRVGTLRPAPLPGGEQAMRQPWRNLAARLFDGFGEHWREQAPVLAERFAATPVEALVRMLARRQHAPLASSTGRLFDAVAAALGICFERIRYEGEAAIRLEHLAASHPAGDIEPYPYALSPQGDVTEFDPRPLWPVLLEELARGAEAARIARRFHLTVAAGFAALAIEAARKDRLSQVVLTGGVLQNRLLADLLRARLEAVGLSVLEHQTIPANDGGLALGQAVIAAATCLNE